MCWPFLWVTDRGNAAWGCAVVFAVLLLRSHVLARVDWDLLLVFVLMFIDPRLLAGFDGVRSAMGSLGLAELQKLYAVGIAASQLVSNAPATIALVEYSRDWRVTAYAVNVGSFGVAVGSLANLIALRMTPDPRAWLSFHLYAVPCLLVAAAVGYGLLFARAASHLPSIPSKPHQSRAACSTRTTDTPSACGRKKIKWLSNSFTRHLRMPCSAGCRKASGDPIEDCAASALKLVFAFDRNRSATTNPAFSAR